MKDVQRILRDAIGTGEVLRVIYRGGTQPGTWRDITPQSIQGNRLIALCHQAGKNKSYDISELDFLTSNSDAKGRVPDSRNSRNSDLQFVDVRKFYSAYHTTLLDLASFVDLVENEQGQYISLRRSFKNGKPMQTPFVVLSYELINWCFVAQPDGTICRKSSGPRQRPWGVRAKHGKSVGTFKDSAKAIALFLEIALDAKK